MKTKKSMLNWFAIVAVVLAAVPLRADMEASDKGFTIGPRATYFKAKDAEKGSWFGGVQARVHPTPALGLEGSIDYRENDYANDVIIRSYPVQATLLIALIPSSTTKPFILGGAGWYHTRLEGPSVREKTESRFGVHAGGGLEVRLHDSLSVDGSYRYIWLEDMTSRDVNALERRYRESGSMVTVALNLLF